GGRDGTLRDDGEAAGVQRAPHGVRGQAPGALMRLLVSVASAADAVAALEGGASFIDAKTPAAGALGAVTLDVFHAIVDVVGARRPVTAALGDAVSPASVETDARMFALLGAHLVK